MITSSLSRSRRVSFNRAFDPMHGRLSRFLDRTADAVCNASQRFSWILSNWKIGLIGIVVLLVPAGILLYNLLTHK